VVALVKRAGRHDDTGMLGQHRFRVMVPRNRDSKDGMTVFARAAPRWNGRDFSCHHELTGVAIWRPPDQVSGTPLLMLGDQVESDVLLRWRY